MIKLFKESVVLLFIIGLFTSCGDVTQKVEDKINELNNKTEQLDSIVNKELNKVKSLDSIISKEGEKVKKLDSLIIKSTSKIDSIAKDKLNLLNKYK